MKEPSTPPAVEPDGVTSQETRVARALGPGERLGRWVLVRTLGEGATATVWAARHEQLGAEVAIKVFHRKDLPFHTVLGEAKAAAGIPSRNAIWVYDVDTFDGHHAIVMELCADGDQAARSLRDAHPKDHAEAARWIAEAARGLAAAHDGGVFHKDVKPANILLNPSDGRAQITDFGLANPALWRPRSSRSRHAAQATVALDDLIESPLSVVDPLAPIRGSMRLGTPEFMAPEQAVGLRRDLDGNHALDRRHLIAIDVYGLGATLWYLLVGHPPFPLDGADPEQMTPAEIMAQVVERSPPTTRKANPKVPRRLAAIVDKAMHRDPLKRYPDASALADDLDAWRTEHPTSLDRGPIARAAVHLWRERALTALLVVLAFITAGSTWVVRANDARIREQSAQIEEQRLALEAQEASFTDLERKHSKTEAVLDKTRATLESTRTALSASDGAIHQRDAELAARDAQLQAAADQLAAAETALTETSTSLDDTRRDLLALQLDRDAQLAQLESTRRALADTSKQLDRTSDALSTATENNLDLRRTVDDLESDIAARSARIAALEKADAASRQELATLRDQVTQARQRITELRAEADRLRAVQDAPSGG